MKNAAFYSVFSITAGTINAYCFKKKGAEKFIEGQDSACCYWLGTGKCPEENVFPARNVFFFIILTIVNFVLGSHIKEPAPYPALLSFHSLGHTLKVVNLVPDVRKYLSSRVIEALLTFE